MTCGQILTPESSQRLHDTLAQFFDSQLGLHPGSIFLDEHNSSVYVILKHVFADAERNGAKDKRIAELIIRAHKEAFWSISDLLITACSKALGLAVEVSSLLLDPESNLVSLVLTCRKE